MRQRLAQSWALVALEVKKKSREGAGVDKVLDTQDALNRCLPVILIQCIYRLLVDGFAEQRARNANFFGTHKDDLLSVEQLLGDGRGQPTHHVVAAINYDNLLKHPAFSSK